MADSWASSDHARWTMRANRRRDTDPEIRIRRELHRCGLRYRVDAAPLRGLRRKADVVLSKARIAVFVDGCYWHGCPIHFVMPKTNIDYWAHKIRTNVERDRETDRLLEEAGWLPLRYWEHEDPAEVAAEIVELWRSRTGRSR
ncbi:very short patch repair endonuclease [Brevibacterium luteolum]|uniref:very short patch repair endonuclease n=1 Tax=Brevibacterium luteolum TaxID=199591 RepID=UPI00387A3D2B